MSDRQVFRTDSGGLYVRQGNNVYSATIGNIGLLNGGGVQNGINYLKNTYGIDYNAIPTVDNSRLGDMFPNTGTLNHISLIGNTGAITDPSKLALFAPSGVTSGTQTVNTTPNVLNQQLIKDSTEVQGMQLAGKEGMNVTRGPDGTVTSQPLGVPSGWDAQSYAKFKAANPNAEPNIADLFQMREAAGQPLVPPGWNPQSYATFVATNHGAEPTPEDTTRMMQATKPAVSTISNPVAPPATTGAPPSPTLPTPTAASSAATYVASATASVNTQREALKSAYDTQVKTAQDKIDTLEAEQKALQSKQDANIGSVKTTTDAEVAEKRAQYDLEKQRADENYNANQALVNEMDGLLTQGNQIIEQMKNTTGLSSIMNPRIAKTMSDVQARAGVIQAVLAARNGQIGQAQNQLATALSAIDSITNDQLDYYKTLNDFYQNQKDENGKKLISLDNDKQRYNDAKISLLENDLANTQKTADIIRNAMLDPDTAQIYGRAGVSLNDTPEQIAQKLSSYTYSQELTDLSNKMALQGYTATPVAGATPITLTDSRGLQKNFYPIQGAGAGGVSGSGSAPRIIGNAATGYYSVGADGQPVSLGVGGPGSVDPTPTPPKIIGTAATGYYSVGPDGKAVPLGVGGPAGSGGGGAGATLDRGSSGPAVQALQQFLVSKGFMSAADAASGPGSYGPKTQAAVAAFQQAAGVDTSGGGAGTFGPRTQQAAAANGFSLPGGGSSSGSTGGTKKATTKGTTTPGINIAHSGTTGPINFSAISSTNALKLPSTTKSSIDKLFDSF
jgi:hypothetical protein